MVDGCSSTHERVVKLVALSQEMNSHAAGDRPVSFSPPRAGAAFASACLTLVICFVLLVLKRQMFFECLRDILSSSMSLTERLFLPTSCSVAPQRLGA